MKNQEVHQSINEALNNIKGAQEFNPVLVEALIQAFSRLGSYTPKKWLYSQSREWEMSLKELSKKDYSKELLGCFIDAKIVASKEAYEPISFLILEMQWNIFKDDDWVIDYLKKLTIDYSHNYLFFLYYGNHLGAIIDADKTELQIAFKKTVEFLGFLGLQSSQHNLGGQAISVCLRLFHKHVELHEYDDAYLLFEQLQKIDHFMSDTVFSNIIYSLPYTIMQGKSQYQLNISTTQNLKAQLIEQSDENRKKSFEQLVIFTAVITFLITAASSVSSASFPLLGIATLGITLLTFVLSIMMCLDKPDKLRKDSRFKILVCAFLIIILLTLCSTIQNFESLCLYNCGPVINEVEISFKVPNFFQQEKKLLLEVLPPLKVN